jgi:hypothetical protein
MEECGCSSADKRRFKIVIVDVWVIVYFFVFGGDTSRTKSKGDDVVVPVSF